MENQHRQISGYRDLNQVEIDFMNEIKALGEEVGGLVEKLRDVNQFARGSGGVVDQRWLSIGATHLQQGFMALVRAVARPTTF